MLPRSGLLAVVISLLLPAYGVFSEDFSESALFPATAANFNDDAAEWTWRNPLPQGNHLNRVVWTDDRFVAVGEHGTVVNSLDGEEWRVQDSPVHETLHGLIWTGTEMIAVGAEGVLLRSPAGESWQASRIAPNAEEPWDLALRGIAKTSEGVYVVVGSQGSNAVILRSADGNEWIKTEEVSLWARSRFNDVVWTGDRFVVVGEIADILFPRGIMYTSEDGIDWKRGEHWDPSWSEGALTSVTWTGEEFVAAGWVSYGGMRGGPPPEGLLASSPDGIDWTKRYSTSSFLFGADWVDGKLIATGANFAGVVAREGEEWEVEGSKFPLARSLRAVAGNGNALTAVGERIGRAEDGDDWRLITRGTDVSAGPLVYVGNGWLARAGGGYLFSPDAINWFERRMPFSLGLRWRPVWSGDGIYAVGTDRVAVSSDGDSWEMTSAPPFEVTAAAWAEDRLWVGGEADGHAALAFTLDGEEWHPVGLPEWKGQPRSIIWTGDELLIVGVNIVDRGQGPIFVLHSEDFQAWERDWLVTDEVSFRTAGWSGDELRVIVERTSSRTLSIGWNRGSGVEVSQIADLPGGIGDILWNQDRWLGVGSFGVWTASRGIRYHGFLASSLDGVEWEIEQRTSRSLHSIAMGDDLIIVAGASGQILTLGEIDEVPAGITRSPSSPRALAGSGQEVDFLVEFTGNPPPHVEWQESVDEGETWGLAQAVPTAVPAQLRVISDDASQKLYRALLRGRDEKGEFSSDAASIDYVSVGEVVGSPDLEFALEGHGLWRLGEKDFHSGDSAIRGLVLDAERAVLATRLRGPGRFSFWWRRYSDRNFFAFSRNEFPLVTGTAREWRKEEIYLGPGDHELTWTLGGEVGIDGVTLDTFSFEPGRLPETDYGQWAVETMGEAGTARSGPFADFNKDGVSNLENYAFGLDPMDSGDRQALGLGMEAGEEGDFLTVEGRLRHDPDLRYFLETTDNLSDWQGIQLRYVAEDNSWLIDPEPESLQISHTHEPDGDFSVFTVSLREKNREFVRFRIELEEEE